MRLIKPNPLIYLFLSNSAKELGEMFVRPQEFYENSDSRFRGQFFTLEQFQDHYAKNISDKGKFTYYEDFFGYNIPGDVLTLFFSLYSGRLSDPEKKMFNKLGILPEKYYVIGAEEDCEGTIDHELSHAFFHLFETYRAEMLEIQGGNNFWGVREFLRKLGYDKTVFDDETTSYLLFDRATLHRNGVKTKHLNYVVKRMQIIYKSYKEKYIQMP